jgi:hypothetical protein
MKKKPNFTGNPAKCQQIKEGYYLPMFTCDWMWPRTNGGLWAGAASFGLRAIIFHARPQQHR